MEYLDELRRIAAKKWKASREEAEAALIEAHSFLERRVGAEAVPALPGRYDWRTMPRAAKALVEVFAGAFDPDPDAEGPDAEVRDLDATAAVFRRVERGGGATMRQLKEVTGLTEREIRAAIDRLRERHQSDDPLHLVSYQGAYWLARELSAMGKDLQPTARGTLRVVAPGSGGGGTPRPVYRGHSRDELLAEVRATLESHPDAEKVLVEVVARIDEDFAAREYLRAERKRARDLEAQADANFAEAVEEGRDGSSDLAALQKLYNVEQSWQARQERYAEAVEIRKEARERKKAADAALQALMGNLRQLEIDFPPAVEG